jgi:lysophospholipase L1-like esterase
LGVLALACAGVATAAPDFGRWHDSFEAFAAADKAHAPAPGGVVFVGSSSIRLWNDLEQQFDAPPVIVKRGFGGSRMSDCANYVGRLVVPYKPHLVVVYAGDNDLAEGRSPQEVLASFRRFVAGVRKALPETRIAYLSIKPSPRRAALMPAMRETNALIAQYSKAQPNLDYIDVFSKMLDAEGRPRSELYRADALHLNADGYALWKTVISAHLR